MAIQMRRGNNVDLDPSKMVSGEFAVTTDNTDKVYIAFKPNRVAELAKKSDLEREKNALTDKIESLEETADQKFAETKEYIDGKSQDTLYEALKNLVYFSLSGDSITYNDAPISFINLKIESTRGGGYSVPRLMYNDSTLPSRATLFMTLNGDREVRFENVLYINGMPNHIIVKYDSNNVASVIKTELATKEELEAVTNTINQTIDENISQLNRVLGALNERVDNIDGVSVQTVEQLQKQADETEEKLEVLWKINEGQTYDFVEQEESSHAEPPKGAMYGSVEEVYGKTEQVQTNGYQLIDILNNRTPSFLNGSFETNGVTFTLNDDGSVTCKGNATSTAVAVLAYNTPKKFKAGTYTFSGCPKGGGHADAFKLDYQSPNFMIDTGNGDTHVYNEDFEIYNVRIVIYTGYGDGLVFKPMLEIGTVKHDFEPYTGGIPLPSPDYPQYIDSVEEINVRISHGKYSHLLTDTQWNWMKDNVDTWRQKNCATWFRKSLNRLFIITKDSTLNSSQKYDNMIYVDANGSIGTTNGNTYMINNSTDYVNIYANGTFVVDGVSKNVYEDSVKTIAIPSNETKEQTLTITPPRPLNAIGEYKDVCDMENGVWKYRNRIINLDTNYLRDYGKDSNGAYMEYAQLGIKIVNDSNNVVVVSDKWCGVDYVYRHSAENTRKNRIYKNQSSTTFWLQTNSDSNVGSETEFIEMARDTKIVYVNANEETEPISELDLESLKLLFLVPSDRNIFITDQNGNDISYMVEYIRNLKEAMS